MQARLIRAYFLCTAVLSVAPSFLAGCDFNPQSKPCRAGTTMQFRKDPASGTCQPVPVQTYCAVAESADDSPAASHTKSQPLSIYDGWASCDDPCTGQTETGCTSDPRCKATYEDGTCEPREICFPAPHFAGCFPNPNPDKCVGLDQLSCSSTPGCQPVYGGVPCTCAGSPGSDGGMCACPDIAIFRGCETSPIKPPDSCVSDSQCGGGQHCSTDDGDCRSNCPPGQACPAVCSGICVADQGCSTNADCAPDQQCEDNGLWCPPIIQPVPQPAPGSDGGTPTAPPLQKCGQCVKRPIDPPPPTGCASISDERTCVAKSTCEPIYVGGRCFCDAMGCGCLDFMFQGCRDKLVTPPPPPPLCQAVSPPITDTVGTWSDSQRNTMVVPRSYIFAADGTFTVYDAVAPCPPGSQCVWSGIITNHGKWSEQPRGALGTYIGLVYDNPMQTTSQLSFPTSLTIRDCGAQQTITELGNGRVFSRGPSVVP